MFGRRSSIRLMNVFGIRIGVDISWFFVLFILIFVLSGQFRSTLHSSELVAYVTTVVSALLLYGSLIVHELGHALTARAHGIDVRQIDLFLFGGLTRMSRDTDSPGEEFRIAVAGRERPPGSARASRSCSAGSACGCWPGRRTGSACGCSPSPS